jgi:hypothetical protein
LEGRLLRPKSACVGVVLSDPHATSAASADAAPRNLGIPDDSAPAHRVDGVSRRTCAVLTNHGDAISVTLRVHRALLDDVDHAALGPSMRLRADAQQDPDQLGVQTGAFKHHRAARASSQGAAGFRLRSTPCANAVSSSRSAF